MNKRKTLIAKLRTHFQLPEDLCNDKKLLDATRGTFGRARVELSIEISDFIKSLLGVGNDEG